MMATLNAKSTGKSIVVSSIDEKKEEAELDILSSLDSFFEQYRVVRELAFDIEKKEKCKKLSDIKKKIESLIERIDERYPYKQTLNIKASASKTKSKKGKISKTNEKQQQTNVNMIGINEKMNMDYSNATISRARYLYFVGRYYKLCGNLAVSKPLLQEAIKLNPELIECWNSLGDIYFTQNEMIASKFCFESALEYDEYNKISYLSLSKILRKPIGKNQMQIMENCIESLILAKQALKYGKKWGKSRSKHSKNTLKDGELWFNLGNAYLMTFLNCINGWKLNSSAKLEKEEKEKEKKKSANTEDNELTAVLNTLGDNYFSKEYETENIRKEIRREIETELNDTENNLLFHVYIKKCLSAYKCAATKCTVNKHQHHPDLYCNRSHIHIYQEKYEEALHDLKLSIKYSLADDTGNDEENECQAKIMYDELLAKLCKISKQIGNRTNNKVQKKINGFCQLIRQYMKQCSDYYTKQLHYDLVDFKTLNEGLNGGNVIIFKILNLMQPANQLPLHFICIDSGGSMFVLSFYLRGHALNHMYKILNQTNIINPQTLICVANPLKRCIKFTNGSKHIQFHSVSFQKPQDICIGGKFFFNK